MHRPSASGFRTIACIAVALTVAISVAIATVSTDTARAATAPAISAGRETSMVLKSDGTVWTFGNGGIGLNVERGPRQVPGLSGVTRISAGFFHTLALKPDGTVWAFGKNVSGQLGRKPSVTDSSLGQVGGLSNVVAISAGGSHSVVVKADGTVWTFGFNRAAQLGRPVSNSPETEWVPQQVVGLSGVVAVAAGGSHTVALKSDGTVWTFGWNIFGQLGRSVAANLEGMDPTPAPVGELSGIVAIAASEANTVALKSDGTVWTFGSNASGQLGRVTDPKSQDPIPTQVAGLSGIRGIATGGSHTLALAADGSVFSFGLSLSGQLGRKTATQWDYLPTLIPGLSGVSAVAASSNHSVALKTDGSVWTFGTNTYGEAGRNADYEDVTPGVVPGFLTGSSSGSPGVSPTTKAPPTTRAKPAPKKKPKKFSASTSQIGD